MVKNNKKEPKTKWYMNISILGLIIIIIGIGLLISNYASNNKSKTKITFEEIQENERPEPIDNIIKKLKRTGTMNGLNIFKLNNKHYMVYILEEQSSGGTQITIEKIERNNDNIIVTILETRSSGPVTTAFTTPHIVVKVNGLNDSDKLFKVKSSKTESPKDHITTIKSAYENEIVEVVHIKEDDLK